MNKPQANSSSSGVRFQEKLAIVSHVVHYQWNGRTYAYAPYVREIEIWARMFDQLLIAAPCREQEPPGDCAAFESQNLRIAPQREAGGETIAAKLKLAFETPLMAWDLCKAMRQADAIHVRCPGNLGLLGTLFAPLFSKHLVAKFAGQWNDNPNDARSTRFQRSILRSRWWGSPVTVYGEWPNQPDHVIPFFSSAITDAQVAEARSAIQERAAADLRHVLFVGRLSRAKNVDVLLQALAKVRAEGITFSATIAGEGPELSSLQQLSTSLGLSDSVAFTGGVEFDRIVELLKHSGVLVLASETEGWPKAIVESMAFGLVSIGSEVGLVPQILADGRGFTVPPRDVNALANILRKVLANPEQYAGVRARAAEWASRYTIESLESSLRSLLAERWHVTPAVSGATSDANEKRGVLSVGSFVASKQGTRGISEDISIRLASSGWNALTTSRRAGRVTRLADMLSSCWRQRHRYQVAAVDVYSGMAFTWAETVCSLLRRIHKPYVVTLHGGLLPEFAAKHPRRVRNLLNSAIAVTAPSQYLIEQMRAYRNDLLLIPNAIDTRSYRFHSRKNAAPKLVWLRAFHELYNPVLAVRVMARLVQEFPDAHLTMIGPDKGDGSLQRTRQEAERLGITGNVTIKGSVPKQKVPESLAQADIFLNTSGADNTPVTIIEAMACGLCIASTNVGGIPYLLTNETDALLVPPNDVAAMTNAIRRILTEPALAERLSSRAHRKASQFDWQTITPQWDRLLLGAIQGRLIATENDLAPAISAELPERPREFVEVTPAASRQIV
jgi:glycosyltransferase involved in cell wall biosynthesis